LQTISLKKKEGKGKKGKKKSHLFEEGGKGERNRHSEEGTERTIEGRRVQKHIPVGEEREEKTSQL